jgi:hypothetical protein
VVAEKKENGKFKEPEDDTPFTADIDLCNTSPKEEKAQ